MEEICVGEKFDFKRHSVLETIEKIRDLIYEFHGIERDEIIPEMCDTRKRKKYVLRRLENFVSSISNLCTGLFLCF